MESSTPPESRLSEIKEQQHQQTPPSSSTAVASVAGGKSKPSPLCTVSGGSGGISAVAALQLATQHSSPNVLHTPTTPRIDISRASSSSHHDSRDSSPENVFDQVNVRCLLFFFFIIIISFVHVLFPRY